MKRSAGRALLAALVVLLLVALIDVAIEGVFARANVSGYAVGIAVLACIGLAVSGRRALGEGSALVLGGLLLGLIAFSAWRAGGLDGSGTLTIAHTSADIASGGIALAALIVLIVMIAVAPRIPAVVRITALLVLGYCAYPIGWSLFHGTGLVAALRTNVPISSAPFYLQGAYLAVEVIFPLCALIFAIAGVAGVARRHPRAAVRAFSGALVFLILAQTGAFEAAVAGLPTVVAFEQSGNGVVSSGGAAATSGNSSSGGSASSGTVTAANPTLVVFPDDVAANVRDAALAAGPSLQSIYNVAAVQVADDIYPGALRGASGTLAAAAGNSADKALLLRDLIRSSDPNAALRFASCTLSDADAQTLVNSVLSKPNRRSPIVLENAVQLAGSTNDTLTKKTLASWALTWRKLTAIAKTETTVLTNALNAAPAIAASNGGAVANETSDVAAVRNHVWLQRNAGPNWVDLDPSLGSGGFGHARCSAAQTMATLPDDLFARIVVRLRVEERDAGVLAGHDALAASLRVADLSGRTLSLLFAEPLDLSATGTSVPVPAASGDATATPGPSTPENFTPLLEAGTQWIGGTTFSLPPVVFGKGTGAAVAGGASGAAAAFGSQTPSPTPVPIQTPNIPDVTGVWLRVEPSNSLGASEPVVETLLDRIGFVARTGTSSSPAPAPPTDGSDRYQLSRLWNIGVWTGAQAAGVGDPSGFSGPAGARTVDVSLSALGLMQSRFMAVRAALYEATVSPPGRYAVPGPSVSLIAMGEPGPGGTSQIGLETDIATDRTHPRVAGARLPLASAAAWAIASVLSERLIAHGGKEFASDAALPNPLDGRDALAILGATDLDHYGMQTLAPADIGRVAMLDESDEGRARISEQLRAGRDIILPAKNPVDAFYGWWVFDPNDGSVRDEMSNGRHDEAVEESFMTRAAARMARYWRKLAGPVCIAGSLAAAGLTAASGDVGGAKTIVSVVAKVGQGAADQKKKIDQACKAVAGGIGGS